MGKIAPVASKYIIHANIEIEGIVDKPDVIGAIFGQTEGLLGAELELRELQRSGRIGRIEVNADVKGGKTKGAILIPSSLDKAETSIVAASMEIIQRIGPCNAKLLIVNIEDVRISKRIFVIERAKELLQQMQDTTMPDSQELADEVSQAVRVMEICEYGPDRLPAGPAIEDSEEVIIVEGRADVLNLLKHGIKNSIAMNGTSCPQTIKDLSRQKDITVFVDGDRGGNLIIKELLAVAELDFVTRAPDGKEVEELAKKEIHKALRSKINIEQAKMELASIDTSQSIRRPTISGNLPAHRERPSERPISISGAAPMPSQSMSSTPRPAMPSSAPVMKKAISPEELAKLGTLLEQLVGTRGAFILDDKLSILGKVPTSELATTIKSLNGGIYAVVLDGIADRSITSVAEAAQVKHVVAMDRNSDPARVNVLVAADF